MGNTFDSRPGHDWGSRYDVNGNYQTFCLSCNSFYHELGNQSCCSGSGWRSYHPGAFLVKPLTMNDIQAEVIQKSFQKNCLSRLELQNTINEFNDYFKSETEKTRLIETMMLVDQAKETRFTLEIAPNQTTKKVIKLSWTKTVGNGGKLSGLEYICTASYPTQSAFTENHNVMIKSQIDNELGKYLN